MLDFKKIQCFVLQYLCIVGPTALTIPVVRSVCDGVLTIVGMRQNVFTQ